jgi:DNA-binding Xre family transcriptional regulator
MDQHVVREMPFYSSHTTQGSLVNTLREILDRRQITSFKLSKLSDLSPTTTRKIYYDQYYIPSPDVLERICLSLNVQPGEILKISPKLESTVAMVLGSGVLPSGL